MIPVGYMFKTVMLEPDWLQAKDVDDIYSVSNCVSKNFADYTNYWKHNGYWLFDCPAVMEKIARENKIDLSSMTLFYYEVFEDEYDEATKRWSKVEADSSFPTSVEQPIRKELRGFDVVSFSVHTSPECSPLSCNSLAGEIRTNRHCLLESFDQAKQALEDSRFDNSEPGPFRIFAVYTVL